MFLHIQIARKQFFSLAIGKIIRVPQLFLEHEMDERTDTSIDPDTGEILLGRAVGEGPDMGAQRPGGVLDEAALRLDKRTYLDREQGQYRANLTDFGGGLAEVGWAFVPNRLPFKGSTRGESDNRAQNEERAVRRARSAIRKKVLMYELDHLLTLTYRQNVTEFASTNHDLNRFVRLLKKRRPNIHYVAVPERQERGAWHWHLAVKGRQDVDLLRQLWRYVVGEGNIDVQKPKPGRNRRLAMVSYLCKYLSKGFKEGIRELNGHRYRSSVGMEIPTERIVIPQEARRGVASYVVSQLMDRTGTVGHVWIGEGGATGWACSWK